MAAPGWGAGRGGAGGRTLGGRDGREGALPHARGRGRGEGRAQSYSAPDPRACAPKPARPCPCAAAAAAAPAGRGPGPGPDPGAAATETDASRRPQSPRRGHPRGTASAGGATGGRPVGTPGPPRRRPCRCPLPRAAEDETPGRPSGAGRHRWEGAAIWGRGPGKGKGVGRGRGGEEKGLEESRALGKARGPELGRGEVEGGTLGEGLGGGIMREQSGPLEKEVGECPGRSGGRREGGSGRRVVRGIWLGGGPKPRVSGKTAGIAGVRGLGRDTPRWHRMGVGGCRVRGQGD